MRELSAMRPLSATEAGSCCGGEIPGWSYEPAGTALLRLLSYFRLPPNAYAYAKVGYH